ncbi:MAG: flagellar protein FlgN [Actinobacteria bacterium]|nr:flagellar protein FlgN [Actinomycetota bacterium]
MTQNEKYQDSILNDNRERDIMEQEIKDFLNCMDNEISIYGEILSLVEEEKNILVKNEELNLEKVVKKQEMLIKKIDGQEIKRVKLLARLNGEDRRSAGIRNRINKIRQLIMRISEINNTNVFLIEQGQKNIRAFLELILGKNNPGSYLRDGRASKGLEGNIFIDKTL